VLQGYGRRAHTRTDHLALAAKYLGWKSALLLEAMGRVKGFEQAFTSVAGAVAAGGAGEPAVDVDPILRDPEREQLLGLDDHVLFVSGAARVADTVPFTPSSVPNSPPSPEHFTEQSCGTL
jgi:hypothetical protein